MSAISKQIEALTKKIDKIDSCKELASVQEEINIQLNKMLESTKKALAKLQPMSNTIEIPTSIENALSAIQDTIKFVNNLVTTIVDEITQLQQDIIEITNAMNTLQAKLLEKANVLSCSINTDGTINK